MHPTTHTSASPSSPNRRRALVLAVLAVASLLAGLGRDVAAPAPAAAYPSDHVELLGHGWGHGRGLGQYGALGYAIDHGWGYGQILDHYYNRTTAGSLGQNLPMSVRLTARDGKDTIVVQEKGGLRTNADGGAVAHKAMKVRRTGPGTFMVAYDSGSATCAGPWGPEVAVAPAEGRVTMWSTATASSDADHTALLQVCQDNGTRWYRGTIFADTCPGGTARPLCPSNPQITVNHIGMEDYLRGVVPRESPASWGDLGGGKGIEALRAQSVAARSYAAVEGRWGSVAKTCDTTSCQVYYGRAEQVGGLAFKSLEDPRTDRAIGDTAQQVRKKNGAVESTEFSSSTGGWTADDNAGAPVIDEGDDVSLNRNHSWTKKIAVSTIEARYGKGTLEAFEVVERNGFGAEGGRARKVRLTFSGGVVEQTGDQIRSAFGLLSDWFTPVLTASMPYHVVTREGGVYAFGGAPYHGSITQSGLRVSIRGMAEAPGGYWLLGEDGGVFSYGAVQFHGSMGGQRLNQPVVGMAPTPSGNGYWLVASDGGIFSFGDARFHGSTGGIRLNQPIVGMAPTPSGNGYWLVASDGGIFSFGDATFHGSTGAIRLNQPIVAMHPRSADAGGGYWLLARDGGLFSFGGVPFHGSLPGRGVAETAVGMASAADGSGYLIATAEGRVYGFGSSTSGGGPSAFGARSPAVTIATPR